MCRLAEARHHAVRLEMIVEFQRDKTMRGLVDEKLSPSVRDSSVLTVQSASCRETQLVPHEIVELDVMLLSLDSSAIANKQNPQFEMGGEL